MLEAEGVSEARRVARWRSIILGTIEDVDEMMGS